MPGKYFKDNAKTILEQFHRLKMKFPNWETEIKNNLLITEGFVQPTPISINYNVKISYKLNSRPDVQVLSPKLISIDNETAIPHIYPGQKLCLYYPRYAEWSKKAFVADTIINWTSLWLYYYEMWHSTKQWLGGGIHLSAKK